MDELKPLSTEQLNDLTKHIVNEYAGTLILNAARDNAVLATVVLKQCDETSDEFNYLVKTFGKFLRIPPTVECITGCHYINKKYALRVRLA